MAWKNVKRGFRKFAKKAKRVVGRAVKSRYGTFSKPKINNIVRDVAMLKTLVNAEKKHIETLVSSDVQIGQVDGGNTGAYIVDITPTISQGDGSSQRNGDSLKITGMLLEGMAYGQASTSQPIRIVMDLWTVPNQPSVTMNTTTLGEIFNNSPISQVIDASSLRNPDYFRKYRKIATKSIYLTQDSFSGQTICRQWKLFMKLQHHLHYVVGGAAITSGQIFATVRCDSGNKNVSNSGLPRIPTGIANTGAVWQMHSRYYYTDN